MLIYSFLFSSYSRYGSSTLRNMESTFRANERKVRSSKARKGADEIYKPKWEYYELMLFLKKTYVQSDTIDNLSSRRVPFIHLVQIITHLFLPVMICSQGRIIIMITHK